jgi:hypothetical protein
VPPLNAPYRPHRLYCVDSDCTQIEVKLNTSSLSDPHALFIPLSIFPVSMDSSESDMSSHDPYYVNSLLDCGSDHCFIDMTYANKYDLSFYSVGPYCLRYMDGSTSTITQGIQL